MTSMIDGDDEKVLRTSAGDLHLNEYRLAEGDREWAVLHCGAVLSHSDESEYLLSPDVQLPYGITLWAASIALAHDLASRSGFRGKKVLELGAGTGLPGIVAASGGAHLVQTDGNKVALALAKRNLLRNRVDTAEQRHVDWTDWGDDARYDWILGSDILYSAAMHPHLRHIFDRNLSPGGTILISDPFRATSIKLFEEMEQDGWSISITKWRIGEGDSARPIGVFELVADRTK